MECASLETGDVVLSALPEGAAIERKKPNDLLNCIGASRDASKRNSGVDAPWAA
jgi:ERCC4-type nuclease